MSEGWLIYQSPDPGAAMLQRVQAAFYRWANRFGRYPHMVLIPLGEARALLPPLLIEALEQRGPMRIWGMDVFEDPGIGPGQIWIGDGPLPASAQRAHLAP